MHLQGFIVLLVVLCVFQCQGIPQKNRQRPQAPPRNQHQQHQSKPPAKSPAGKPKGRILEGPEPNLCATRESYILKTLCSRRKPPFRYDDGLLRDSIGVIHEVFGNKGYWYSWKDPVNNKEVDWLDGRNFCRKRCMDLVSLETSVENEFIKNRIVEGRQKYIWTSGRLCDFKGCENREDLKPIAVNGWFWSAELRKLAPTTNRQQNDWSPSGGIKKPQPDNREFHQGGAKETCLAILNNFYGDGIHWHDVACHHRKPIVCEDSQALLSYVRATNPTLQV